MCTNDMVTVLMSSYNGEKYIQEQLESILNQTYRNLTIAIRDDGSKDHTIEIIKKYSEKNNNIIFFEGNNVGVKNSFFSLINQVDENSDFFAFADQDDYWDERKLEVAIKKIKENDTGNEAIMYCSALNIVDENLKFICYKSHINDKKEIGIGNAMVENINTGCTCVINKKMFELLKKVDIIDIQDVIIHDWWIYLVATSFGKVIYDNKSYIKYRQHNNNCIGEDKNKMSRYLKKIKKIGKIKKQNRVLVNQVNYLVSNYRINDDKLFLAEKIIGYKDNLCYRLDLIINNKVYRMSKIDNIILRFQLILGII